VKQGSEKGSGDRSSRDDYFKGDQTVGEILLSCRERAGLTLEYVSQETKVPRKMLEYLETDNFEAIPAKVYVKGFLRSYADLLGLDANLILSKYEVQTGQTHISKGDLWEIETEIVEEKLQSPQIVRLVVLPAIVVIAAVIVIVRVGMREKTVVEPPSMGSILEEVSDREEVPLGVPVDSLGEDEGEGEGKDDMNDEIQDLTAPPPEIQGEPVEQATLTLELIAHPNERTWFDILTVSSVAERPETTAFDFILFPGESKTINATDAFILLTVSNAGGFTMKLNGRELPSLGDLSDVKQGVVITRDDLPKE
jgi:cytoskeleton protein RodZ